MNDHLKLYHTLSLADAATGLTPSDLTSHLELYRHGRAQQVRPPQHLQDIIHPESSLTAHLELFYQREQADAPAA